MSSAKQIKRKLSESEPRFERHETDRPAHSPGDYEHIEEAVSPLSENASPAQARDDDLVSAAAALASLNGGLSPPPESYPLTPRVASPLSTVQTPSQGQGIHPIVQSVNTISRLSLVSNAVKYYETSKRNYATFNYAAGIVEKAAIPMINKIEVNLNNIHQARLEDRARRKKRRVAQGNDKKDVKKRIKFCLHILKLANEHISTKVNVLQQRIQESDEPGRSDLKQEDSAVSTQSTLHASSLDDFKIQSGRSAEDVTFASNELTPTSSNVPEHAEETNSEVVETVKKIIHVISNFRPSALNGEGQDENASEDVKLKSTIREIILNLPQKVSSASNVKKAGCQEKAIIFAKESLDMIGRLTVVFNEQLEKAETWVDGSKSGASSAAESPPVQNPSKESNNVSDYRKPDTVVTDKRFSI